MLEAAFWGFVGGAALLLGAAISLIWTVPHKVTGLVMGFGTGVLISAVAFELTAEPYREAGFQPVLLGLLAGSVTFFVGDLLIDRRGGHRRKNPAGVDPAAAPAALVLGALLDGIPESAAIGVSLLDGGTVGIAVVVAVFLSNVPESLAASTGMLNQGHSRSSVLRLWLAVTAAATVAAAAGNVLLQDAPASTVAFIQAFAAGAILTMLSDTMVPEAVHYAHRLVGLVSVLGFALAFAISVV